MRGIKEAFVAICRRYGGRVEDSTCFIPLKYLYYALDEFGKEVERERLYSIGAPLLRFVGEETEPRGTRIVNVQVIPHGREADIRVWLSKHVYDRLYKTFRKEEGSAEGTYSINLENEYVLSAQGKAEASWRDLGYEVSRLISDLSIQTTRVADVDDRSWRWFKKKVEESRDWWELTRR